jgi:hypothetical protein
MPASVTPELGRSKNICPISPQSLRDLLRLAQENGADPKQAQDMLGHAHIETPMLYALSCLGIYPRTTFRLRAELTNREDPGAAAPCHLGGKGEI